jgi:O-antigen ligase
MAGLIFAEERIDEGNIIEFIRLYPIFIFCFIAINECLYDEHFIKTIVNCLKITLVFSFVFLCCQFVFGVNFSLSQTLNSNIVSTSGIRYPSFLIDPQVYAQFLGAISFLCILKMDNEKGGISKLNYLLTSLALICILIAGGRAGLIGWVIGLVLIVFFSNNLNRIIMIICGTGLYFLAMNFKDKLVIFNRGTDLNDTYEFRASVWQDAYQIFLDHPFAGIGLNNYARFVSIHNPDQVWMINNEVISFDHPESGYLKFLTEMGGIGFILIFSFILIPVISSAFSYLKHKDNNTIILFSALICWLVGFYSTYSFGDTRIKILVGSIISIMIAYHQLKSEKENEIAADEDIEEASNYSMIHES